MATERENFGGRFAVIMALAGSAIGLGNIWRFPYMVGEYGGAAFILIYDKSVAIRKSDRGRGRCDKTI